jgi:hypothetical protein
VAVALGDLQRFADGLTHLAPATRHPRRTRPRSADPALRRRLADL